MTAKILDGKAMAQQVRQQLAAKVAENQTEAFLAVVLVGDDEASKIYDRNKKKAANEIGMGCEILEFSASIGENALLEVIEGLNADPHVSGILVQLPLPEHINPLKVLSKINPEKDVDGFSPYNAGLLACKGPSAVVAATPKGIVGRPLAMLLLNQDCTVTVTHSKTRNLEELTRQADILVAACGCAKMVKKDWVKPGAVVIDVGINRVDGKLCGDVDFDEVKEVASYITPVPGGVGPMTVAMLMENVYDAARRQEHIHSHPHGCGCGHKCCHH